MYSRLVILGIGTYLPIMVRDCGRSDIFFCTAFEWVNWWICKFGRFFEERIFQFDSCGFSKRTDWVKGRLTNDWYRICTKFELRNVLGDENRFLKWNYRRERYIFLVEICTSKKNPRQPWYNDYLRLFDSIRSENPRLLNEVYSILEKRPTLKRKR